MSKRVYKAFLGAALMALAVLTLAAPAGAVDAQFNRVKAFSFTPVDQGVDIRIESQYPILDYTFYDSDPETFAVDLPDVILDGAVEAKLQVDQVNVAHAELVEVTRSKTRSLYRLEIRKAYLASAKVDLEGSVLVVSLRGGVLRPESSRPDVVADAQPEVVEEAAPTPMVAPVAKPTTDTVALGPATKVTGISKISDNEFVISLNGEGHARNFTLTKPDRIVLDLTGVSNNVSKSSLPGAAGDVVKVRISQFQVTPEKIARVVFDLNSKVPFRVVPKGSSIHILLGDETMAAAPKPAETVAQPVAAPEPVMVAANEPVANIPEPMDTTVEPMGLADAGIQDFNDADPILFEGAAAGSSPNEVIIGGVPVSFEEKTIGGDVNKYSGEPISFDFKDADIRDIIRFFSEISGLNFVVHPKVSGNVTITLKNVPWDQAMETILHNHGFDYIYQNNVVWVASKGDIIKKYNEDKLLRDAKKKAEEPTTWVKTIAYANASDIKKAFETFTKGDGGGTKAKIIVDNRTNTLIIEDIPSNIEKLKELVTYLDKPTPQVLIEARFVEAQSSWSQSVGFRFITSGNDTTNANFPNGYFGLLGSLPDGQIFSDGGSVVAVPGLTGLLSLVNASGSFGLDLFLEAFESQGRVRVVSAPRVTTQNNESASIQVGTQIPVVSTTLSSISISYINAALSLEVTPQITADGYVVMEVSITNNTPSTSVVGSGGIPAVNTRQVETKLRVKNGGTAVIGGVFVSNEDINMAGVPFLSRIPVLGWLFKRRQKSRNNTEMIIFLTPKIVS